MNRICQRCGQGTFVPVVDVQTGCDAARGIARSSFTTMHSADNQGTTWRYGCVMHLASSRNAEILARLLTASDSDSSP